MIQLPLLGSHLSIAGGYYKAADTAASLGMDTVQIFSKNNNQWKGKPLSDDDVRLFREAVERAGLRRPCAHDSYLINLASPDDEVRDRSVATMVSELEMGARYGARFVNVHIGSHRGSGLEAGVARVAEGLRYLTSAIKKRSIAFVISDFLDEGYDDALKIAAMLHDAGKVAIPDAILKKPGKLDPAEYEIMKTHTTIGARILLPGLAPGRSTDLVPFWGITPITFLPWNGSAIVYWDSGTPAPLAAASSLGR